MIRFQFTSGPESEKMARKLTTRNSFTIERGFTLGRVEPATGDTRVHRFNNSTIISNTVTSSVVEVQSTQNVETENNEEKLEIQEID